METAELRPGQSILEVGSGTGVHSRWLAEHTNKQSIIIGIEINDYLIEEANNLARSAGCSDVVTFRFGNAESLPFPDGSFDLCFAATVMEEVDAVKMLHEMIRVTKPGGKVAVIVRAEDERWVVNLPIRPELKNRIEGVVGGSSSAEGCADASLYRRFQQSTLTDVKQYLHHVSYDQRNPEVLDFLHQAKLLVKLNEAEKIEWETACQQAEAGGTFIISNPFHCAVGTKMAKT